MRLECGNCVIAMGMLSCGCSAFNTRCLTARSAAPSVFPVVIAYRRFLQKLICWKGCGCANVAMIEDIA